MKKPIKRMLLTKSRLKSLRNSVPTIPSMLHGMQRMMQLLLSKVRSRMSKLESMPTQPLLTVKPNSRKPRKMKQTFRRHMTKP